MTNPTPPVEIETIHVIGRREAHADGATYIRFFIRINAGPELPFTALEGLTFDNDTVITFEAPEGVPAVVFDSAIPAAQLLKILNWFYLVNNFDASGLTSRQARTFNYYLEAYNWLVSNSAGLEFVLGSDTQNNMETRIGAQTGRRVLNSERRVEISVNSRIFEQLREFGENQVALVMFHEILHLNPEFNLEAFQEHQRRGGNQSFADWHLGYYEAEARRFRTVVTANPPQQIPEPAEITAQPQQAVVESFDPAGNIILGNELDNEIRAEGEWNSVDGLAGSDTYILSERTGELGIYSAPAGEVNTLKVEGPYTLQN